MSTTTDERRAEMIDGYKADLLSGKAFSMHAMSHRSRYGYKPPTTGWPHAMAALAGMAAVSDPLAQVASAIIGRVNLYGDDAQLCAAVYEHAATAIRTGYTDYVGLAGPEPGRRSDRQRAYTLHEVVAVAYWLAYAVRGRTASTYGPGWCLAAIAEEVGFRPPATLGLES